MSKSHEDKKSSVRLFVQLPSRINHFPQSARTQTSGSLDSTLTILAVDFNGDIDKTRNDEIELILTSLTRIDQTKVRLESNLVKLVNGEAIVGISSEETEFVRLTVQCKNVDSALQPYTTCFSTSFYPRGGYTSGH